MTDTTRAQQDGAHAASKGYAKDPEYSTDAAEQAAYDRGYGMMPATIPSTSDARTSVTTDSRGNVFRHAYRTLSDEEKALVERIKDLGEELHGVFTSSGASRELALAKTKLEEAVMWAVKHVTGPKG